MKNLKVSQKMTVGFASILLLAMLIGAVGIVSSSIFLSNIEKLHKFNGEHEGIIGITKAHYTWRHNLMMAIATGDEFKGSVDPATCALGSWLGGEVAKNIDDPETLKMLSDLKAPHDFIHYEAANVVKYLDEGNLEEAQRITFEEILPKTQEVLDLLSTSEDRYGYLIEELDAEIASISTIVIILISAITLLAVIVAFVLARYISGMISKPLQPLTAFLNKAGNTGDISLSKEDVETISRYSQYRDETGQCIKGAAAFVGRVTEVSEVLNKIANGDLTGEIALLSQDDVMGQSVYKMLDNMNNMFGEINSSSSQVDTGARQIADGAQALSQGSTEQAASVEQLSSSISEIATQTKVNADMAEKAYRLSESIRHNAEKGNRQMDEMMVAVRDINTASQNISKVIKVIDDIAFQTNILALNAAVEAARAGQHGKGFAVVAEEVRNLAAKSAEAAKETGDMIQNSMEKAELGSRIAGETAVSFTEIASGIQESSKLVEEIAKSSKEQAVGISQVNIGIDQVAQVVQQNSATAQESAAASEEMSGQSAMLQELISQFRLKG
ncbi:MAG: methyl-accepting chemotaxis protein [Oscillospiraceae bacterium]|nr:methyl-accepting chemotaxis protein [Oscillospiraceae bacterium]